MLFNNFKTAFRNLKKYKTFSLINILGFAFGISVCLGIAAYLLHEYSFDRYHTHSEHIYRLIDAKDNSSSIDYRVKDIVKTQFPEIENACLFQLQPNSISVTINNKGYFVKNLLSADNEFFDIFTVPLLHGNKENPLTGPHSTVITQSTAKMLFGDEDPMGKEITLANNFPLQVSGIIEDFPDNSSIQAQMIVSAENENFRFSFSCERGDDESTYRWPFRIYLLLNEKTDIRAFVDKMNKNADLFYPYEEKVDLLSLTDMYLHDNTWGSDTRRGNAGMLELLLAIGLSILVLAMINYINLTAAQQNKRVREIGIKKSIGAGKTDILLQYLTESVIVSFISLVAAVVLLSFSMPVYRMIFYETFHVYQLLNYWPVIILSVVALGIISGCGTAFMFSSLHPLKALKGEILVQNRRLSWRNALTVFQFVVSIALFVCIIVMQKQIHYVKHNNPGFNEEQLLKIELPQIQANSRNNAFAFIHTLEQNPGAIAVTLTNGVPGNINTYMGANVPGKKKSLPIIYADSSFLKAFGINIINGREPLPGDYGTACLINESAYKYFEWTDLTDKKYNNGRPGGFNVIGVVPDFHYNSLHSSIEPLCILLKKDVHPTHLSIKLAAGSVKESLQFIQEKWQELLPQYPLKYEFYDSWLDAMYREDEKLGAAIGLYATLAIVISCLGIFGMTMFSIQRRTSEIGVRKVVGATVMNIFVMLTKHFIQWVLIANIVAWPIAWYAMHKWLQSYAYRIELTWWMFAVSGALALGIALLTTSWQVIRAATANPVDALRYE